MERQRGEDKKSKLSRFINLFSQKSSNIIAQRNVNHESKFWKSIILVLSLIFLTGLTIVVSVRIFSENLKADPVKKINMQEPRQSKVLPKERDKIAQETNHLVPNQSEENIPHTRESTDAKLADVETALQQSNGSNDGKKAEEVTPSEGIVIKLSEHNMQFQNSTQATPTTSNQVFQNDKQSQDEPVLLTSQIVETDKLNTKNDYAFVKITPVSLIENPETKREIGRLKIGDFVRPIDKQEYKGVEYTKVLRKTPNGDLVGWVRSNFLSSSLSEVLGKKFDEIQFPVFTKKEAAKKDVRGIFLTRYSVDTRAKIREWVNFAKRNNLNTFVIDVKDDDGFLLFKMDIGSKMVPIANERAFYTKEEMKEILNELKSNGIYVIARIVCFKDPSYAKTYPERAIVYKDSGQLYTGIYKVPWASAYDRQLWKYNVEVARETIEVGFDEIQYDYIRFPELREDMKAKLDLRQQDPNESFPEAIQRFLLYARRELEQYGVPLAIDVFGLSSTAIDDVGIGQHWEALSSIADIICPMVYPSHYANGVFGLPVPDAYPYETVYNSVLDGIKRNLQLPSPARIRPWIQSFTATWVKGHIVYDEKAIKKQIKALKDLGINEYMLWNASNKYLEMHYE
uniref:DUF4015 domain-containing protein n=1 Tax=Fervidobacterium thailandense TaxID=1008305 RepID=A0A7C4GFS4_9BACT